MSNPTEGLEEHLHDGRRESRREARIREVMSEHVDHDSWEGDLCDDVPGDHRRYKLLEKNDRSGSPAVYLTTHHTPTDAAEYAEYHDGQEHANDWIPVSLTDLDTGLVHEITVYRTFEYDPPIEPEIVQTVPHPERAESRPCFGCGKEIQPGQLYLVKAPFHVRCPPKEIA